MANDGEVFQDCLGSNCCGGECDDCPLAAIVGGFEKDVVKALDAKGSQGLGPRFARMI